PGSGWGFDFRARLEGRLPALLVLGVEREEGAVVRTHDDSVMAEGARRRPCRRVGVVRGCMTHDVLERDFRPPFTFEVGDPIDRHQRTADVARDRVEDLELFTEALGTGRTLHVEDADDLVSGSERRDHRLTRLRVAPTEPVVVDRAPQHDAFAAARDPPGDPLIQTLLVPEWHADADRGTHPKAIPLDEHDRSASCTASRGDVLGGACQKG